MRDLIYRGRVLKTSKIDANGDAVDQETQEVNGDANGDISDDDAAQSQRNDPTKAWVMAVYEDDAGEELRWKRTVTTAGQSEYRINNKVVPAKRYNEALEAENILIKARNFLVFQGDVEGIANQTPKDMARLIEQISGSLEYKSDYERLEAEEAQASQDYIEKTNDRRKINTDIRRHTDDKKEADNYNRKQDERDDAIVNHVLWKLYHFQQVIDESSAQIEQFQNEIKEHKRGVERHEKNLDDARKEQTKVGRDLANHERSIKRSDKAVETKRNEIDPINEKLKLSRKNQEQFSKRLAKVREERDNQSKAVDKLNKELSTIQKAQGKWEQEWKQQTKKEGRQLSEADLQEYNRLRSDVNKKTANAQIKLDALTRQRKTDEETVLSFKTKTEECEQKLQKLQTELQAQKQQKTDQQTIINDTTKEIESKKKEYNKLNSNRTKTELRHTDLEEKLQQVLKKLFEADDGRRQNEKELRAKELVLNMKRLFPSVRGRVHELCKPKQKMYDDAVSTVLGRHFDSIVVDTEKTSRDCIAYLKDQRAGMATFIPLDTIQVNTTNPNMKGMHQKARLALDVIEYEAVVERAMAFACGNSLICDDLDTARHLGYERRLDARLVTLDGTVIHKGGLMTGGRGPNDKSRKNWDETHVDGWLQMKNKLLDDLAALPKAQDSVLQEEALQSDLSTMQQRVALAQDEVKTLGKNVESKKKETAHIQQQLDEYRPKYDDQSSSFEKLKGRIAESQSEVSKVEDEVFSTFCKRLKYDNIRSYESQQGSLQQEGQQKKLEFAKQQKKLESQLNFETQRVQATNDRITGLENSSEKDRQNIANLEAAKDQLNEDLEEAQQTLHDLQQELATFKEQQDEQAASVAEARRELGKQSKQIESMSKSVNGLEAEVQRNSSSRYALLRKCKIDGLKVPLAEDSMPLDSLPVDEALQQQDADAMDVDEDTTRFEVASVADYGIQVNFDELDDDLKEDSSATQETSLQKIIADLNSELSSLNPNMRAIDRLTDAKDRLAALDGPFADARRLARDTHDAFEDIRSKRADLFDKAFKHIASQIEPIYKKLTQSTDFPSGGQAGLDMTYGEGVDDTRPFDGGIKYYAMPPAKRFRDIEALSGGEKSIAALALLFAVHSYAPSPFFVLDEVDAALDNANVAKVARYIREHKGPGMQFVVISLKTGLFQESDTLCGIMRDQGANTSRAVTLDVSISHTCSRDGMLMMSLVAEVSAQLVGPTAGIYPDVATVAPRIRAFSDEHIANGVNGAQSFRAALIMLTSVVILN